MSNTPVPRPGQIEVMYAVMTSTPMDDHPAEAPDGIEPLLRRNGATEELLGMWRQRPYAHLIIEAATLADVAQRHVAARTRAFALAASHDGVVVDLRLPRLLVPPDGPITLAHANQWVVVHYDVADHGIIGTRGLESFGLPELCVTVPEGADLAMCGAVTSGVTYRLLAEWPHNDPVGPAVITLRDIAYGLGDPNADDVGRSPRVDVTISYDDVAHELDVHLAQDPAVLFT